MIVSVTVIPAAACWLLRDSKSANLEYDLSYGPSGLFGLVRFSHWINEWFAKAMRTMMSTRGSWFWRLLVVLSLLCGFCVEQLFVVASDGKTFRMVIATWCFAILLPPPGYNIDKMIEEGESIEKRLTPYWAEDAQPGQPRIRDFFFVARGRMLFLVPKLLTI